MDIKDLPTNTQLTLSCYYSRYTEAGIEDDPSVNMSIRDNNNNVLTSVSNLTDRGGCITLHFTTPTSTIKLRAGININPSEWGNVESSVIFDNLMLVQGNTELPFERAYSSPFKLTEENNCKILSFNINEKTDLYFISFPYNEMTIEVDNEQGYFTDYSPNCILPRLNNDCYIDLFMKINNDNYYKIMTMNFNKVVSTNYEKAVLSFTSNIDKLSKQELKDKNYQFFNNYVKSSNDIVDYFLTNYNLLIKNTLGGGYYSYTGVKELQDILLNASYYFAPITTDFNNDIVYKSIAQYELHEPTLETISDNLQLDRPAITKTKEYEVVSKEYELDNDTEYKDFNLQIQNTLDESTNTIVIRDRYAILSLIEQADITTESDITIVLHKDANSSEHVIVLEISGEVGTSYTININKTNLMYTKLSEKQTDNIYYNTSANRNNKLVLNNDFSVNLMYYIAFIDYSPIMSKVEVRCIGLPYLEIGDIIDVENYLTTKETIAITDLDINYDGGLTMTIKGYSFDWPRLFPSNTLYPSDTLYPNAKIIT